MPEPFARLVRGFVAGALAHLLFQGALGFLLHRIGWRAEPVWSLAQVGPFAMPATLNAMFWDGLWGMLYAAAAPRLLPLLGRAGSGLALAGASLSVYWLIVLPLKGAGLGGGFELAATIQALLFDTVFGLGTAWLYSLGRGTPHQIGSASVG